MAGIPSVRKMAGQRFFLCLSIIGFLCVPHLTQGQSAVASGSSIAAPTASFQILEQRKVNFGQHSVTLNRVTTPVFPAPVVISSPVPTPLPSPSFQYDRLVFFGAIVYDHQYTVVRGFERNQELVVVSNIDFDYLSILGFVQGDTFYDIFMALDIQSSKDADSITALWLAQARASLSGTTPAYVIVSGSASADEIEDLNALHSYYAANSAALVQAYQQQQAANAARALQLKLHPPRRPNTVINYWPIKSSVYLKGSHQ